MTLLTADDVLNKKFQATKFREGYEQDEVDEFLDEVVEAMRQLEAENADLKAKLEAANRRVAQLGEGASIPAAPASPRPPQQTPASDIDIFKLRQPGGKCFIECDCGVIAPSVIEPIARLDRLSCFFRCSQLLFV